jgi:NAD(P)-dependent dehydrogenase (short-subunit alcohol dehydrogenase family)
MKGESMERLQGKVAIVTGAGSGIGRAASLAFAREGARVLVADVVVEGGEETAKMVREAGGQAIFVKTDVSRAEDVKAMVDSTISSFGRLDCAFNNAGISGGYVSLSRCPEDSWDRMIAINLKGVFLCMKYELPKMLKSGGGSIVNTSSIAGMVGDGGHPAYAASKHGVVGLTRTAAIQYAKAGIRVNAVCPGVIRTPMTEQLFTESPELKSLMVSQQPMDRLAEAEEVARVVVWLCTDEASFITGHPLPIDGGYLAR